jgi:glutathione peroxidase
MTNAKGFALATVLITTSMLMQVDAVAGECPAFMNHQFQKLHSSKTVDLCAETAGKPVLIVNTASHCGFTPQFKGLEAVYEKYKARGLVVIGFPSNDFRQEASDEAETAEVCYVNYGVTFTMLAPSAVKGPEANPVFQELNRRSSEPSWNFNKYLVSADGEVVQHFKSNVAPESDALTSAIEKLLPAS